jgi:hypothetical protein
MIGEQSNWKRKGFENWEREVRRGNTMKQNRKIENNGHMIPFWVCLQHCNAQNGRKKKRGGRERGIKEKNARKK